MKYNKLGHTDIDISVIGLGTMTYGEQNTEQEAWEQLDYAIAHKVNFIDTAELYAVPARSETYGLTELYIGNWMANRKNRDQYLISSKIAGPGAYTKHIRDISTYSKQSIIEAVEGSLKRLQTSYIDLYQIHWPERKTNTFGQRGYTHHQDGWESNIKMRLEVLKELTEAGKIKYIGISNETPWGLMQYKMLAKEFDLPMVVSIQNPYSLLNRTFEVGLAEMAIREQVGLLAYSPLAFGKLTNKYIEGTDTPECRLNSHPRHFTRYNSENTQRAAQQYYDLAQETGLSLAQLSLAWINQQPFITTNIIGARTMDQLRENIASAGVELDKKTVTKINKIHETNPNPAP
jgi:aryl-alcohol dehydrogenase-like predicted oxidoreductase